jgi:hypothetical protein
MDKKYLVIFKKDKKILTVNKFLNYTVTDVMNEFKDGWMSKSKLLYIIDGTDILYPNHVEH